ncbi:MAG: mevalonate kinase [Micropruina sp.]|nr:mevalonate kinase [Micropruina sp.]
MTPPPHASSSAPAPDVPEPGAARGSGQAHAKAILLGEHAAVYGSPAIAVPVGSLTVTALAVPATGASRIESDLYAGSIEAAPARIAPVIAALEATQRLLGADDRLDLHLRSSIPHSRGLGSSAAVAAAVAHAVAGFGGRRLSAEECYDIVQTAERIAHGNPSGLDARAVVSPSPIRFQRGVATTLPVGAPVHFVLADSGVAGSTAEAVGGVARRRAADPAGVDAAIARLADLAEAAVGDLAAGDPATLGGRMRQAHTLLAGLGVSSPPLDALVAAAGAAGSLGAKLTGGGLGGCVIALAGSTDDAERIARTLRSAGAERTWTAQITAHPEAA